MIPRTPEPEVMDTPQEAADYDRMDHTAVNRAFAADFLATWPERSGEVLDVGTGTAQIPIELCRQAGGFTVRAVDAAAEMLKLADANVATAGFSSRIGTELVDAKMLAHPDGRFDAVISNSIVHHIPEPAAALAEMVRVCRPGGALFVRDLLRPESAAEVERLVASHAAGATADQKQLFRQSLHAALTVAEVRGLVAGLGFAADTVTQTSDRHWTWAARKPA
jgi:ubiquinone/menaquinone biosynthesis C-methylase UbiE